MSTSFESTGFPEATGKLPIAVTRDSGKPTNGEKSSDEISPASSSEHAKLQT